MKSWKAGERVIAERLGGKRIPITGRTRGDVADVSHPDLALEIKTRHRIADWLLDAMRQAEAVAANDPPAEKRLPLAIWHEDHAPWELAIVTLRLKDFEDRFMTDGRLVAPSPIGDKAP